MTKNHTITTHTKNYWPFLLNFPQEKRFIKQFAEKLVYVFPAILLFLTPAMATATGFLPPVYHLLFHPKKSSKRIFILGSSTVHTANYISGDFNDPYGADRRLQGWGEQLFHYAKDPGKIYNRARSGSDSISYRTPYRDDEAGYKDRYWGKTEELINATNDGNGGFLLIQFGANDPFHNVSEDDFKHELRTYIGDAKRLGLTPVLISPINHRNHHDSRPYAEYVESVADNQDVLFLDLHKKSMTVWAAYAVNEDYDGDGSPDNDFYQTLPEADIIYGYLQYNHDGINNNHLSPIGAQLVAGWVKELACQSDREDGRLLCAQFLDEIDNDAVAVREDGEDGDITGWTTYATTDGSIITNIYDAQKKSRVIELFGNDGTNNGFRLNDANPWEETEQLVLSWSMKYSENFTFYVSVDTDEGYTIFEYQPTTNPGEITANGRYRFGLGNNADDGNWHTFRRDIQADLKALDPNRQLLRIHRIAVRGSGRLDDIKTMKTVNSRGNEVPPCVAVIGEANITVDQGSVYTEKGATASDDMDGNISANIVTVGTVDTSTPGTYTISYSVHDNAGNGAMTQRTVHIVDPAAETVVIHEDAQDGDTVGWSAYNGAADDNINNVAGHGGRVISFSGQNGTDDAYAYNIQHVTEGLVVSWAMNFDQDFKFMARVLTENNGPVYITYVPEDIDQGYLEESGIKYAYFAVGSDANDGTWRVFTRDIVADLHSARPDFTITAITGFRVRGTGLIDDISTQTRAARETFSYDGHSYKIVKTALSWQEASTAADNDGGYLANIGSIAENHEIYSRLFRYIEQNEYGATVADNGGGASYVWIGGNDIDAEGTWIWENNTAQFWSGGINGQPQGGLFSNWGRNTNEEQHEPDNANNIQDAAGIALNRWPVPSGSLGQTSQWNDLNTANELFYIIEHDQ